MQFVGQKNDLKKHVGLLLVWEEGKRYYFFFNKYFRKCILMYNQTVQNERKYFFR